MVCFSRRKKQTVLNYNFNWEREIFEIVNKQDYFEDMCIPCLLDTCLERACWTSITVFLNFSWSFICSAGVHVWLCSGPFWALRIRVQSPFVNFTGLCHSPLQHSMWMCVLCPDDPFLLYPLHSIPLPLRLKPLLNQRARLSWQVGAAALAVRLRCVWARA